MSYNNGYDDDDDFLEERSRFLAWIGPAIVVLALIAGGWFVFRAVSDDSKTDARTGALGEGTASSTTADAPATTEGTTTTASTGVTTSTAGTSTTSGSEVASTTAPAATSTVAAAAPVTTEIATTNPTVASAGPEPAPSTAAPAPSATETTGAPVVNTLPDGSFPPVVAVFDADTITLSGAVPSPAAVNGFEALAVANSKTPATVDNRLTIEPSVPAGVGARIIELNSVRFPSGSAEVLPEHAQELNRIAAIMSALPNITTLVVGHADQVGSAAANFALSEARARNVVTYLVSQGIAPARLSSRAVGDQDLLSVNDDATSLALNRRTEFIIYGLLIG